MVGLGNVGARYEGTRHNVGFVVVEGFGGAWRDRARERARVARVTLAGRRVTLAAPQTFMNESGAAVQGLLRFYRLAPEALIVVHDDADLAFGDVRVKFGGGSAGHNGVKSIVATLGTEAFWRVRVGIGRPENPQAPLDRYVLERWSPAQAQLLDSALDRARHAVEEIVAGKMS